MKAALAFALLLLAGPLCADKITLKDGQLLDGSIVGHDAYFLDAQNSKGTQFHIPWSEVRSVQSAKDIQAGKYLSAESADVESVIAPVTPGEAVRGALGIGFLVHGWGHHLAHSPDRFYALMGAEALSLTLGVLGAAGESAPSADAGFTKTESDYMLAAGAGIFVLSYLYDVAFAPSAAANFNQENGLALNPRPLQGGAGFQLTCRY